MPARKISTAYISDLRYSICTLVSRPSEYSGMIASFIKAGFTENDCEFLYADNSECNEFEAFSGINRFLREARGEFVIICHQDILITVNDRSKLEQQIKLVTEMDPSWAVLGNAGVNDMYHISMVITHHNGQSIRKGILPSRVQSLDENFILVKASANLAVAGDLKGFHLYGTDICLVAECLGYTAYAIDFHLVHNGQGIMDESFSQLSKQLSVKYATFFRARYIRSTMTSFYVSSNHLINQIMSIGLIRNIARQYHKLKFRLKGGY